MQNNKILTSELLALYAGGEVQISDPQLHIGSIRSIQTVKGGKLIITLNWLAKASQRPTKTWTYENKHEVQIELDDYKISDFGKRHRDTESRLSFVSKTSGPNLLLFSAEMPNKLDARSVKGLPAKAK